jgi:hypothetical protein
VLFKGVLKGVSYPYALFLDVCMQPLPQAGDPELANTVAWHLTHNISVCNSGNSLRFSSMCGQQQFFMFCHL